MVADTSATDDREGIMQGVYAVLADEDFAGVTSQRGADAADYSQSLVHYHFGTKEDLVVAFLG